MKRKTAVKNSWAEAVVVMQPVHCSLFGGIRIATTIIRAM